MDEKEILASAAEELTREGDIETVHAELVSQRGAAFPTILFIANLVKDIVDFPVDMTSLTGVTWLFYIVIVVIPISVANFFYMWGKLSWVKQRALGGGTRFLLRRYKRAILRRLVLMGLTSIAPIVNMLFPQCLFIVIAHNSHRKFVRNLLEAVEVFAEAAATGNYRRAVALGGEYASEIGGRVVRAANVSGRIGDRFGERARAVAQRMEGNVTRAARRSAGRAIARVGEREAAESEIEAAPQTISPAQVVYAEDREAAAPRPGDNSPRVNLRSAPRVDSVTAPTRVGSNSRGNLGAQKFNARAAGVAPVPTGRRVA